ncbi:Fe3+ hydroxamate ABC transporter substrate-binding protein [Erythrobacter longus]|uniref:Fe3+ hydroxamate ABC transporter substrate-binding protein n=1 Tax=Erythrobacter longus TaxID=1044 RepID=A0A074MH29_ERYLO|nr:GxxExxY protein [Erythrobacter longus]KEO91153.1 Fe3+ hydroxamate ABC transporter substrate-binding protein [Erythrobacter longus]
MEHDAEIERLATIVIDCGFHIHKDLGPGLLESAYELILAKLLEERGVSVRRQVAVPIHYQGVVVDNAFKIDLLVEERLVVELKSTERNAPVHAKQVLTYLRLMELPLGMLMNFGLPTFKGGLQRVANNYFGQSGRH